MIPLLPGEQTTFGGAGDALWMWRGGGSGGGGGRDERGGRKQLMTRRGAGGGDGRGSMKEEREQQNNIFRASSHQDSRFVEQKLCVTVFNINSSLMRVKD